MRKEQVQLRVLVTESQAETVQERIGGLPFKVIIKKNNSGRALSPALPARNPREIHSKLAHDLWASIQRFHDDGE